MAPKMPTKSICNTNHPRQEKEKEREKKNWTQMMLRFDCSNERYLIDDSTPYVINLITYLSI